MYMAIRISWALHALWMWRQPLECGGGAEGVERPGILAVVMAQDVNVSVGSGDAEMCCAGGVPAVIDIYYFERAFAEGEPNRPLVRAIPRITFHANSMHRMRSFNERVALGFSSQADLPRQPGRFQAAAPFLVTLQYSALYADPSNMMMAVKFIHSMRPMAVAKPPYTRL
jgi:hypothetical protein